MENMDKHHFFRVATGGLGKYSIGGYGQIGVYRFIIVNIFVTNVGHSPESSSTIPAHTLSPVNL